MHVHFSSRVTGTTVEHANGEYRRIFNRADEPFEVTAEEAALLFATGLFESTDNATAPVGPVGVETVPKDEGD